MRHCILLGGTTVDAIEDNEMPIDVIHQPISFLREIVMEQTVEGNPEFKDVRLPFGNDRSCVNCWFANNSHK